MVNPFDIYTRAAQHLPLTPGERAFLKTCGALWQAALAAGAVAIIQAALAGGRPLTFATLAQIGAVAAATALVAGAAKLIGAHGDPIMAPISSALNQEAEQLAQRFPVPMSQPMSQPAPQSPMPARYSGASSTPLRSRMGGADSSIPQSSFPPLMPDSAARRARLLGDVGVTQPVPTASAASAALPADAHTPPSAVPQAPTSAPNSAPAQSPTDTEAEALAVTQQMAAVGARAPSAASAPAPATTADAWTR